jgi:hypothetical protein
VAVWTLRAAICEQEFEVFDITAVGSSTKDIFGRFEYSAEYTFPVLFVNRQAVCIIHLERDNWNQLLRNTDIYWYYINLFSETFWVGPCLPSPGSSDLL